MNAMWTELDKQIVGFFNPLAADPAVRAPVRNDWPLHRLDHAVYTAMAYLVFVIGCKLMLDKGAAPGAAAGNDKKKLSVADKIRKEGLLLFGTMALYNATQVALCAWMVYASLVEYQRRGFSPVCNSHKLTEDGMAFVLHIFYLSKVLDFADTVFMIVKRSWRQMSFLHVYHHTSIFLIYWLNAQAFYDGDIYLTIVLNGTIHFIMYGYYLATSFNVQVPTFIKKSITNAQLIQFCCMESQGAYILLNGCDSPRNIVIMYMVYISTMLALFMNFKAKTYSNAKTQGAAKASKDGAESDGGSTVASESEVRKKAGKHA